MVYNGLTPVIVTDPPFNIGYHYKGFRDRLPEAEYYAMLADITDGVPAVIIHYPEQMHKLSIAKGEAPERVVSWIYNSNTAKQHRDVAFYGVKPDFSRVKQPYKNQNDKRIKRLIAEGRGARLYDWWQINQVKNTTRGKSAHPCQMPIEVMDRIVGILPDGIGVIDPFLGSGTTAVACRKRGVPFIGYEVVHEYAEIARKRLAERIRMMYRWTPYIPFHAILQQAMREMLPEGTNYCEALADLIDRPTCRLELTDVETHGNAKVRIYECSECGRPCEEIYGKYERCPHCGAVVTDD